MKAKLSLVILGVVLPILIFSQDNYTQYFDGEDTISPIIIEIDTATTNIWQIGPPQKVIFDSSATQPNAIVTDTINYYPIDNTSQFQYTVVPWTTWGLLAIQWKQKLDMDFQQDGGIIEFSVDAGNTWENAFNNPAVYNFYGYDTVNVDTLQDSSLS